jgi:alpha-beta hydrolase superfamily lysophospholipase
MRTLHTDDGVPLHLRHWAATASPRGTVLVVHGLGEHIGRYAHVAAQLNDAGWQVFGHDHRGHGASGGARGALNRDDDLLRDLARVIDRVRESAPGPLVLLGHSMGGLIAGRFVAEALEATPAAWQRPVDALVMSSPALDAGMSSLKKGLLALLAPVVPQLVMGNGLKPEWVSRDPAVVLAYKNDPLVHDRVTPRLARFIVDGGALVLERAPRWRTPTLLMWAGADRCVAPRGSAAFATAAPKSAVQAREWPGLCHEIFNEPEQQQVLAALLQWLAQRGH